MWYFIEGYSSRLLENPHSESFKGNSYQVSVQNENLKFYKSELSQKWWLELSINDTNLSNNTLIPCSYQDYLDANNQHFSDRIMLSLKRNFV